MKLWEVFKALEENPKRVFGYFDGTTIHKIYMEDYDGDGEFYYHHKAKCKDGKPAQYGAAQFSGNFERVSNWHEVKQPVSWQEALQAWIDGKTIKVVSNNFDISFVNDRRLSLGLNDFTRNEWYIEEEQNATD